MKKILLLLSTFACLVSICRGQTVSTQVKTETYRRTLDENTVVKDSTGAVLTYAQWHPLLISGNYSIEGIGKPNKVQDFKLHKFTPAEKKSYEERKAAFMAAHSQEINALKEGLAKNVTVRRSPPLTDSTVVKDSSGTTYPASAWRLLMRTGQYSLHNKPIGADSAVYFLTKKTQQEKDALMASMPKPAESENFTTGDKFSYFREKDLNGQKLNATTLAGKVIVLNFWFVGCPPCREEIPVLNELANQYKNNKDVVFIAICLDEGYQLTDFLKTTPFNYQIVENGRFTANKYGVRLYPTNLIIDKQGVVAFSSVSNQYSNPYWIRKTIEESLAAK